MKITHGWRLYKLSAIRRLTRQPEAKNKDITSSDPNKNVDVIRHETKNNNNYAKIEFARTRVRTTEYERS